MSGQARTLTQAIEDYGNISVPYRSQQQQTEKQEAYRRRLQEVDNKFKQETQEIHVKMNQHLDLVKNRQSMNYYDSQVQGGDEEN